MIDFDVVTGPGPSEKSPEPERKGAPSSPAPRLPAALPRAALLPRVPAPRAADGAK